THEAEGTRPAHLLQIGGRGEIHRGFLRPTFEDRVIELDLEVHLEAVEGVELGPLVAVLDAQPLFYPHETLRAALLLDSGRLQQKNKRAGAAIHDRYFGGAELDHGVVDSEPGKRRQQMLDRRDPTLALAQGSSEHGVPYIRGMRPDVCG